jgi:hypothetical protein
MSQFVETPTKTFLATAAVAAHLRVKLSGSEVVVAGAADQAIGVTDRAALANGDAVAVRLGTAQGTVKMTAAGAITAGNAVYAAAGGKVASSGTVFCGWALETTTANGDVLEVLPGPNTDISTALAGTTAAAFEVDSDATTPKIALAGQSGGTGDYTTTLKPETTLSGDNAIIVPEANGDTLAAVALAQTLTNKTLTSPVINTPAIKRTVEAHTAGDTLAAAETGSTHSNSGASGTITIVLPAAVPGLEFVFAVQAAQQLRIDPDGTETIALPSTGAQGAAGKYLVADAVGEWVKLVCLDAGTWDVEGYAGTWTAEA